MPKPCKKSAKKSKILILVPSVNAKGGISNYFKVIKNHFSYGVEYFVRGARNWPVRKDTLREATRALKDLFAFTVLLKRKQFSLIQTSTSLGSLAIFRDGLFILVAKYFKLKAVVFFRGLDEDVQKRIEGKYLYLFKLMFFRADSMIVLTSQFRDKLVSWGYQKPVFVETTVVDGNLIEGLDEDYIVNKFKKNNGINLLFLARVEKTKGIYETIDTYGILKKKYPELTLTVAGDGFELEKIRTYAVKHSIFDIEYLGFVKGIKKIEAYKKAHVYIFPSYTEGMPNSVLEAMAFGLPVITRPVGGIVDIFKNGINGFICETKDPADFAQHIEKLLEDKNLMQGIAINNFRYAKEEFTTTKVVARLENIYTQTLRAG